jgi:hypothetical protein
MFNTGLILKKRLNSRCILNWRHYWYRDINCLLPAESMVGFDYHTKTHLLEELVELKYCFGG